MGLGVRVTYELLKKNGKVDTRSRGVFILVFLAMVAMLASFIFMCPSDPWRIHYHVAFRRIGLGMLVAGMGLSLAGLLHLRGLENIDHLVTSGLFAKIRHPMYTGFILWILGWVIFCGAVMSLIAALLCIGNILYWRRLEERELIATYGDAYMEYRKGTWF